MYIREINMKKDLVSIIIPSYNHERFINDSIDGILNQTYDNIEIIYADDNSTDNTYNMIMSRKNELVEKCKNVIIYKNANNIGISKTLNKAIEKSNGKYIKVIASDDILCSDCIERLVAFREKVNEVCFIHSSEFFITINDNYDSLKNMTNNLKKSFPYKKQIDNYYLTLLNHGCIILSPTTFYDKEIFVKLGGYNENICIEDYPFFINVSEKFPIYFLDEATVYYRLVNTSTKSDNRINALIECYDYILKKYNSDIKPINQKKLVFRSMELYKQSQNKTNSKFIIDCMKKDYSFNIFYYILFSIYYQFISRINK